MEIMERESKIEEMKKAIEEIIGKTVMTATEMSFTAIYDIDSKIMDLEQIVKRIKYLDWKISDLIRSKRGE